MYGCLNHIYVECRHLEKDTEEYQKIEDFVLKSQLKDMPPVTITRIFSLQRLVTIELNPFVEKQKGTLEIFKRKLLELS
jgi:hypothetical protein